MIRNWLAAHVWGVEAPLVAVCDDAYEDYGVVVIFGWEW